jgi:sporulation protein YlmC with PRC-barrel domain
MLSEVSLRAVFNQGEISMKYKSITAASAMALMIALPAYAGSVNAKDDNTTIGQDVKRGLRATDKAMYETAENIKAFFVGPEENAKMSPVWIRGDMTARYLIGKKIVNNDGDKVATIKDIIIGKNGKAALVVVSDDGILGIGDKVAAFDYNKVVNQRYDGTVVMALSSDMIDRAADFSYDPKDWASAKIIPAGTVSANVLLEGDVIDSKGDNTASIENIYFRYGDVTQIIVGFNKTLGMGGHKAALDYDDMRMVRNKDGSLDFRLTANQSAEFKNFKSSALN